MPNDSPAQQSLEQLQQRYSVLHRKKIQAETQLESAQQQLAKLRQQAREKYGVDDLEELKQRLRQMEDENEQRRRDYQQSLDRIEHDLATVERNFEQAQSANEAES